MIQKGKFFLIFLVALVIMCPSTVTAYKYSITNVEEGSVHEVM